MARFKAVFFDLYNTLAGFHPPREKIQMRAAGRFGLALTSEGIAAGYRDADALMAAQNAVRPVRLMSDDEREAFFARYEQRVLRGDGHDVDFERAYRVWKAVREQPYGMRLFDDVAPVLGRLREDGLTLGVISNIGEPGDALGRRLGLLRHVDFVLTSAETGADKPDPRMFREALARAGAAAAEAAHVGDQVGSDVEGARRVGIYPVLLDRYGGREGFDLCPRISTLCELPAVLEKAARERSGDGVSEREPR